MDSWSRKNAQPHEIKALLGIGALIVVVALVNGSITGRGPASSQAIQRPENLPDYLNHPQDGAKRVDEIMKKARGDYSKVTSAEKTWLDGVTAGHGEMMVKMQWKTMQDQEKAAAKKAKAKPQEPKPNRATESMGR